MNKYFLVLKNTWDEAASYRFNFAMWRFRNVLSLLTVYYLWFLVIPVNGNVFGYSHTMILTYILGASFLGSIVLSTRTQEIGENIDTGALSNFLIKPFSYLGYWFARDLGDKASNIAFSIGELTLFYLILKPALFLQTDFSLVIFCIAAVALAVVLNFFIGSLLSMVGFWSPDVWAPRFIFFILISFLAGGIFPLDIFPRTVQTIFQFMPFTYFIFFPLKIYLGTLTHQQIITGFLISGGWLIILYFVNRFVWRKGLKNYSSQGS